MTGGMDRSAQKKSVALFIYGPTASGKSDFALRLAQSIPAEIVNMDVAQCYVPLTIGTAKPEWRKAAVQHHLFDVISSARDCTVVEYRQLLEQAMTAIWRRGKLPIVVGGSGFYLRSLLFPPDQQLSVMNEFAISEEGSWEDLHAIDPCRAAQISKRDTYRISRALAIWCATGCKPSAYMPIYNPPCAGLVLNVTRSRKDLAARIETRTEAMLASGFVQEVAAVMGTAWEEFVQRKGFIGYRELFEYLRMSPSNRLLSNVRSQIALRTRQYAKRQATFWRSLERKIAQAQLVHKSEYPVVETMVANLTENDEDSYIGLLHSRLFPFSYE